jgi:hypothetical protein
MTTTAITPLRHIATKPGRVPVALNGDPTRDEDRTVLRRLERADWEEDAATSMQELARMA